MAAKLTAHDALNAHARDETGFSDTTAARPTRAASRTAASFAVGTALPIAVVATALPAHLMLWATLSSLAFLADLGALSAHVGGTRMSDGRWCVALWGAVAMAVIAGAGALFGSATSTCTHAKLMTYGTEQTITQACAEASRKNC